MDRICSCIIAASYGIISTLDVLIKLLDHIVNIAFVIRKKNKEKNIYIILFYLPSITPWEKERKKHTIMFHYINIYIYTYSYT